VREGAGIAAGVLEGQGVNLEKARMQTRHVLNQSSTASGPLTAHALPSLPQEAASPVAEKDSAPLEEEKKQMNDRDRFDKFTERARKVVSLAQEEAQRFQHNYIGTEHLLLGLIREGKGVAAKVLADFGVELDKVRKAVEFIIGHGDRIVLGEIGLTPRSKKVIELAADEARRLNHLHIGTEHLLLGLVREGEGIAIGILESQGVNLDKVRMQTIQVLAQCSAATAHVLPPIPPEAATLVAEGDSVLQCNTCQARCPSYFTYCFHCGSKLKSQKLE
jgi:hypothetical protein